MTEKTIIDGDLHVRGNIVAYSDAEGTAVNDTLTEAIESLATNMNSPLPVAGYKAQSDANVMLVNANKVTEEIILQQIDFMMEEDDFDKRWLAIARTHLELGFMALNRSIFRPDRVDLTDPKFASLMATMQTA